MNSSAPVGRGVLVAQDGQRRAADARPQPALDALLARHDRGGGEAPEDREAARRRRAPWPGRGRPCPRCSCPSVSRSGARRRPSTSSVAPAGLSRSASGASRRPDSNAIVSVRPAPAPDGGGAEDIDVDRSHAAERSPTTRPLAREAQDEHRAVVDRGARLEVAQRRLDPVEDRRRRLRGVGEDGGEPLRAEAVVGAGRVGHAVRVEQHRVAGASSIVSSRKVRSPTAPSRIPAGRARAPCPRVAAAAAGRGVTEPRPQ